MDTGTRRACVVVMESGAEWPDWLVDSACGEVIVSITQERGETPAELALRVAGEIAKLEGAQLEALVVAVGPTSGDDVFHSRCAMARRLIGEVRPAHKIRLLFSAPRTLGVSARQELLGLAGTLASQLRGAPVVVGVHLGASHPAVQSAVTAATR